MASTPQSRPENRSRRRVVTILLAILVFVLLTLAFAQQAFNLPFLKPDTSGQTLAFAALSALVFLLLVALSLMLVRILLKLYAERRAGGLGSKFRTKMVAGALVLSLGPVIFLFLFAYGLMNRSIDKWFSTPIEEVRRDATTVGSLLVDYVGENAKAEAQSIASSEATQKSYESGKFGTLMDVLRHHVAPLQGGFALAFLDGEMEASFQAPVTWPELRTKLGMDDDKPRHLPAHIDLNGVQYLIGSAPVGTQGTVVVGMPVPANFTHAQQEIDASQQRYAELAHERKQVRRTYMLLLLLLTAIVLFAATWFAVFLSKFVTRPVVALVAATDAISEGRLDHRVEVPAKDELGRLVMSFNNMASEIESKRRQLETSSQELAEANQELEQRRRHIETVLENIPTGVLSLDASLRVSHANEAFDRMFRSEGNDAQRPLGSHLRDLFPQDVLDELARMIRKADRMATTTSQMEIAAGRQHLNLAVTVASLKHGSQRHGYVIVFEDLSDLLRAQKQAAWREVARRVAHEIKNPLTPIALSAQRIQRYLDKPMVPDDAALGIIRGCAETISGAVDTVRTLVDEFSTLARFPASQVRPADLNNVVEQALNMFNGRLDGITVRTSLATDLPRVMADPEAMKRAIANLVDNAAEATENSVVREIEIATSLLSSRDTVELTVADSGHGVTPELKEKLFLPYFSTKQRGTGLGLAIVSRIVEDHHGSIRVEENRPVGARFVMELPVAADTASATHA